MKFDGERMKRCYKKEDKLKWLARKKSGGCPLFLRRLLCYDGGVGFGSVMTAKTGGKHDEVFDCHEHVQRCGVY